MSIKTKAIKTILLVTNHEFGHIFSSNTNLYSSKENILICVCISSGALTHAGPVVAAPSSGNGGFFNCSEWRFYL